jgi:hypothetical protein
MREGQGTVKLKNGVGNYKCVHNAEDAQRWHELGNGKEPEIPVASCFRSECMIGIIMVILMVGTAILVEG